MKKILVVHTGGTIGASPCAHQRNVDVQKSKGFLFEAFAKSDSPYALLSDELFEEKPPSFETLSENMTVKKWQKLLSHLKEQDLSKYSGVIVLHGTDTLAYTAALLSFAFSTAPLPIMLVAGDKPPALPQSNAHANFAAAVSLILKGISPNVYVPYRNADGHLLLHIGATLLQCPPVSDDFRNADPQKCFDLSRTKESQMLLACRRFSDARMSCAWEKKSFSEKDVLVIFPYVGMDYARLSLSHVKAILHATYHAGTVCTSPDDGEETTSFLWFARRAAEKKIPLFLAPCRYDDDKYASSAAAVEIGGAIPLAMTTEAAYTKLHIALSSIRRKKALVAFMTEEISGELFE